MAAFSHQQYPFIHDSVFQSNDPITNNNTCFFTQFRQFPDEYPLMATPCNDNKNCTDSSSMVDKFQSSSENVSQKRKIRYSSAQSMDSRTEQGKKQRNCDANKKEKKKVDENIGEEEKAELGYIHVRARRGQATDSHSLAERARREKISEKMKVLQALVPGCDKVSGKAQMLDEIINYVQSLQNQVEFLSTKLASFNPMVYDFGVNPDDALMPTQCSPNETSSTYVDSIVTTPATTFTTPHLLDQSSYFDHPFLLHHGQMPNLQTQDCDGCLLWDLDGPNQKFINPSGTIINDDDLCSFL